MTTEDQGRQNNKETHKAMLPFTSVAIVCQRGLQTWGLGVFVLNQCLLLSLPAPMIWKYAHIFNLYQQNMHDSLAVPE